MGGFALCARTGVLSLAMLALAACQPAEPERTEAPSDLTATSTETAARLGGYPGDTVVLCPGDPRCSDLTAPTPGVPAPPEARSCTLQAEQVLLTCRDNRPCPGPGCPGPAGPGSQADQCRVTTTFLWLNCPEAADTTTEAEAAPAAEPAAPPPAE